MKPKVGPTPCMGEVRVKVELSNVADTNAAGEGKLPWEQVRSVEADAPVDTGAVRSGVPANLLARLGIRPFKHVTVELANGGKTNAGMAAGVLFEIMDRSSSDDAFVLGDEVLIGQTILEKMDLLVDGARRQLVPAYSEGPLNKLK